MLFKSIQSKKKVNMKKFFKILTVIILMSSISQAQAAFYDSSCCAEPPFCVDDNSCNRFSVSAQTAVFIPLDSKVRRIYGSALPAFTLEGNWKYQCWNVWLNSSYIFGNGHAIGSSDKTHLNLVPITFGLKYIYTLCNSTDLYLGLGGSYGFLNIRDHSDFVHKKVSKNRFGGIVKSGIIYNYCENIFFEGFFNYTYQRFTFSKTSNDPFVYRHDADLSSLQLGAGVGMKF
jgi:hypothetical protein